MNISYLLPGLEKTMVKTHLVLIQSITNQGFPRAETINSMIAPKDILYLKYHTESINYKGTTTKLSNY